MRMRSFFVAAMVFVAALMLVSSAAMAQQFQGPPGAPGTLEFPNSRVLAMIRSTQQGGK